MIFLNDIATFLDDFLDVSRFENDLNGIYQVSDRPIQQFGLALEPKPGLRQWIETHQIDGLFLHRPWKLSPEQITPEIGILAYHLSFDENLTIGMNAHLAIALSLTNIESLGEKAGRSIGMIGDISPQQMNELSDRVTDLFNGVDSMQCNVTEAVSRIAIVGAMTDELIRQAGDRGATVYITGQFRHPAREAVIETGMNVIAVGHERSEKWGLQTLATLLQEQWQELSIVLLE